MKPHIKLASFLRVLSIKNILSELPLDGSNHYIVIPITDIKINPRTLAANPSLHPNWATPLNRPLNNGCNQLFLFDKANQRTRFDYVLRPGAIEMHDTHMN